jgi:hypothetical protein
MHTEASIIILIFGGISNSPGDRFACSSCANGTNALRQKQAAAFKPRTRKDDLVIGIVSIQFNIACVQK